MRISVIGLGKLGASLAGVIASKGHTVVGVDLNEYNLSMINAGQSPVFEPGLAELIQQSRERLSATADYQLAIEQTDISFLIVPTPSDETGAFSLSSIFAACEEIGKSLRTKQSYHLVVITSTVMPGATGQQVRPFLERISGKVCGVDFGLCYSPEFVALGSVIQNMLFPDFLLIGADEERAGKMLATFYQTICPATTPIQRMNLINAELAKLAVNIYVTMKISYANMLAQVCENLEGADAQVVSAAIGHDSRIGPRYIQSALGYGGPCFPRDNLAFCHLAKQAGVDALLARATDEINHEQVSRLAELAFSHLPPGGTVGILGLAYKPGTNCIERSQGLELAQYLLARGVTVSVYDPVALAPSRTQLAGAVSFATSADECTRQADILFITTAWEEFSNLSPTVLKMGSRRALVVDCWRILDEALFREHAVYLTPGRYPFSHPYI